jgi:TolB-like protein/Flp pilus assembly protein TadD
VNDFLDRLKERKVVRWALTYVAAAWVAIEVMGQIGGIFDVSVTLQRAFVVVLAGGLGVTVALAWFHGEGGRQRVTGSELALLVAVLVATGATLTVVRRGARPDGAGASLDGERPSAASGPGTEAAVASIAVLPFADLSPGGDQAYLSEGIAEELRGVLSRIEGLTVASSTSSLSVEERRLDPREIGTRLGVAHLVEGSVRRSEDRLRIEARLVSVEDGFDVWSGRFDGDAADIFGVQDSIARALARAFQIRLSESSTTLAPRGQTSDPVAQDLYLRGRFSWNRRTRSGLEEAVTYFRQAVARDSSYARALVGLGDAYAVLGFYDYRPPSEAFPLAQEAARAALAIDSTMAEPHATLGYAALYHDWDWDAAESYFRTAIRLDRGYPVAHQWYANYLTAMGRFDEAEREMRAASELDPLSMIAFTAIGWVHFLARDYGRAVDHLRSATERDPTFELAWLWSGQALEGLGRLEEAEASTRRALELSGGSALTRAELARIVAIGGRVDEADDLIEALQAEGRSGYVPSYEMAKAYLARGDADSALARLRRAVDERSHSVAFLAVDPQLDALRGDPAFEVLLTEANLLGVAGSLR